jgi:hypothetical protein
LLLERSAVWPGIGEGKLSGEVAHPGVLGRVHAAGVVRGESVFRVSGSACCGVGIVAVGSVLSTSVAQEGQILWLVLSGPALIVGF